LTKEKEDLTGRRDDFVRGRVNWLREGDELTKKKDDFIRGKKEFIRKWAKLERVMQKLEGQRARIASRIT
jgi:hypothetical protein